MKKTSRPNGRLNLPSWHWQAGGCLAVGMALLLMAALVWPQPAAAEGDVWRHLPRVGPVAALRSGVTAVSGNGTLPLIVRPLNPPAADGGLLQAPEPDIRIISPLAGSLINSSSVEVGIEVTNFILDPDRVGGPNEAGYGHWHLLLDGEYQTYVTGTEGLEATLTELVPGRHVITVELANNDHTLLGIRHSVNIAIAEGRPAINLVTPQNNSIVHGPDIEMRVEVENFILDGENIGGNAVPGRGHWHLFVDAVYQLQTAEPVATVRLSSPGQHRITVTLSNNDHTSLDPPVIDTVLVRWPFQQYLPLLK